MLVVCGHTSMFRLRATNDLNRPVVLTVSTILNRKVKSVIVDQRHRLVGGLGVFPKLRSCFFQALDNTHACFEPSPPTATFLVGVHRTAKTRLNRPKSSFCFQ